MDLHLIAAAEPSWGMFTFYCVMVLLGVNMVILAHEWGHFIVARMCGVKCEKFYVWFDVFGWKICRFRWGETEYGIGVLPLGGYVKMLGQEDNPARLREELERAKAAKAAQSPFGEESDPAPEKPGAEDPSAIDIEAAEQALYDPRSYLAQSVPKRMAIISAGVVMNVIFALVAAVAAYPLGVRDAACAVGAVVPGKGAWQVGLRPGDRLVEIAGKKTHTFSDLRAAIALGDDLGDGVSMVVRRPGLEEAFRVTVVPQRGALAPEVGIGPPQSVSLAPSLPAVPGSAAAAARPALEGGDQIVRVNGVPVDDYAQIHSLMAQHPEEPLRLTVRRELEPEDAPSEGPPPEKELTSTVAPMPVRRLGLVMEIGPITAIQNDSPAAGVDLRPGDTIVAVDGRPVGDPLILPDEFRRRAQREEENAKVVLSVSRRGEAEPIDVEVPLRRPDTYELPISRDGSVSVPALGVAYDVRNRIGDVVPGSPAAKAGLKAGEVVTRAVAIPPDRQALESRGLKKAAREYDQPEMDVELGEEKPAWPFFVTWMQKCLPRTTVELKLGDGREVTLEPVETDEAFFPDRGLIFDFLMVEREAESIAEAVALGTEETVNSLLIIFRTINKLGTGQVSPKGLTGPVGIVQRAYYSVVEGPGQFLLFLCLISANLAVINFLPIPVLDGGHMVFLAYEGVRGKPPSEGVFVGLSYLGLALILLLMIWVVGLDFGCIARR